MLGLEDANQVHTPATGLLGCHEDTPSHKEDWNYQSVVGMMMYLANNTRPDIAFAVNQVACFANNPRLIHKQAVK